MEKKRVIFCSYPSIFSGIVLKKLLDCDQIECISIICSTRRINKDGDAIKDILSIINISGLRYALYLFCITGLFDILQPISHMKSLRYLARKKHIPIYRTNDINADDPIDYIRTMKPDVIVTAYFNQILSKQILSIPKYCCMNIHPSLLPEYRGVDPLFYACLRNAKNYGVTVHAVDEGIDTGDILAQSSVSIDCKNGLIVGYIQLFRAGADLLVDQIMNASTMQRRPQIHADGFYDAWPDKYAVRRLVSKNIGMQSIIKYISALLQIL